MRERIRDLTERIGNAVSGESGPSLAAMTPLRLAAAELCLATAAQVVLEQFSSRTAAGRSDEEVSTALRWAPALIAPLTAAAHFEHARNPRDETSAALRILNAATLTVGGALMISDLLRGSGSNNRLVGTIGFASAGLLGLVLDGHEREVLAAEHSLRRRADIVERLVPRRKRRLDHVVIHV